MPFLGQRSRKISQLLRTHCRLTVAFLFVDAAFYSGDMRCRVWKSRKSGPKFDVILRPKFGECSQNVGGHL